MSEISAASIIHRTDEKEYITGYWQKRSTGFANLRKAELHSEKQLLWQHEITPPKIFFIFPCPCSALRPLSFKAA